MTWVGARVSIYHWAFLVGVVSMSLFYRRYHLLFALFWRLARIKKRAFRLGGFGVRLLRFYLCIVIITTGYPGPAEEGKGEDISIVICLNVHYM